MNLRQIIKYIAGIGFATLLIALFFFELRKYATGPSIAELSPIDGTTLSTSTVFVTAKVKNISFMYLNGRQIYSDTDGNVREKVVLFPGVNVIELQAKDRFNQETVRRIRVLVNEKQ